ncbi:hypothetical protein HW532_20895 [Kaustia mangrovi]|uniref:Uncharacterized protein n=1 Tax=Kaustia mangrovi TaxID=2593653 RepID=A0A7S8HE26_9HYPH|nr:hypothetical protein [Kaustia mangrovi]QPC44938.1 hypothetical protein HW532_20895 [Kaustia mangrovi]
MSLIGGALGVAQSLFGGSEKPPKPKLPAPPAPDARSPGAKIKVGNKDKQDDGKDPTEFVGFTEKRKRGKSLGGTGRGGLVI